MKLNLTMTNNIDNKINEIFSEELDNNRNYIFHKKKSSNDIKRKKYMIDVTDKIKAIKKLKTKQNIQNNYLQEKNKITNENNNNANDISTKNIVSNSNRTQKNVNFQSKNIVKKSSFKKVKDPIKAQDFALDESDLIRTRGHSIHNFNKKKLENRFKELLNRESPRRAKKSKFIIEENKNDDEEDDNIDELKKRKLISKRSYRNIVMILKEKNPKKPSLFEIIKGSIKEPNKDKNYEENISLKRKSKKNTQVKIREVFSKSIRTNKPNSLKSKNFMISSNKNSDMKSLKENDSDDFIKSKKGSKNEENNINETIKSNNIKKSEYEFFESSQFSYGSKNKEEKSNSSNSDINDNNEGKKVSGKNNNDAIKINNNEESNSGNSSNSDSSENNNDSDEKNINQKQIRYKYNHMKDGVLSIIPELDNKKNFYEDINGNTDAINPNNIISLEKNSKQDYYNDNDNINNNNLEMPKNNIIINNNVSKNIKNIITCYKKESDILNEDNKKTEKNIEEKTEKKKEKQYKVKARRRFPFCCL